ncbi:MAG: insulinase family protein [Bacteroidota bacterium]
MRHLRNFSLLALTLLIAVGSAFSQEKINPADAISTDPDVKIGRLENGLVYYIRRNIKPEKRVEMRLAVNAGSVLESDNQKGLAHFTEHMCFNGTKNFPKNELVDYLQKLGVKFGADINAYTSFDETVYMLQLPSDNKELLEKGYMVLEDWAHNVTFDGKEIDKERGVITEEWRLGLGADDRMRKKYFPVIFKNSKYAERLPIGDVNIIENFKHDTLRDFYKTWYRPDLQAIIVVGDIDVNETEKQIITHFGKIQNPSNEKSRVSFTIPENTQPLVSIVTDKEATSSNIMVFYKHPDMPVKTVNDYRTKLMNDLYTSMLNSRYREIIEQPESPFIAAYNYYGNFLTRSNDAYTLVGLVKENKIESGLEQLLKESERVKRYGFKQSELDRQIEDTKSRYEKQAKEYDKTESARFAREYVSNFLTQEPIPGIRKEAEMVKALLSGITLKEINELGAKWVTDDNLVVVITAPEKESIKIPAEQTVLDIIAKVKKSDIADYEDKFKDEPLVTNKLSGSGITTTKENADLGYTELTLKNGIKVIYKNTDFKNDEIIFSAYSEGGTSLYPDKDYISALFSDKVVAQSGIGNFSKTELDKKLKGKTADVSPYIDDVREGFTGKTSPKDLETLLQLTYLYFTAPRKDTAAFRSFMSRTRNQLKFIGSNPVYAFMDTLVKTTSSNNPRVIVLPKEYQLDQINLDKLYSIYTERFANAGDFKFFFVGNINADTALPLFEKYLGSLPVNGRSETWKDVGPQFPAGITDVTVKKGSEPKSMVGIAFSEPIAWTDANRLHLRMLKEIISIRLIEVIREEMSGVYSPQVQFTCEQYPKSEFNLMVMFGCSPKNTGKLTKAVLGIVEKLGKKGPTAVDLDKAKELLLREREVDAKTNKFWLTKIESIYFNNDSPEGIKTYADAVTAVTIKDLQDAAKSYLKINHYVRAVLLPEDKK